MTIKELFAKLNRNVFDYDVYMRDIMTSTERKDSVNTLMDNENLYNDWKNAIVHSWSVVENEFVLTVER